MDSESKSSTHTGFEMNHKINEDLIEQIQLRWEDGLITFEECRDLIIKELTGTVLDNRQTT